MISSRVAVGLLFDRWVVRMRAAVVAVLLCATSGCKARVERPFDRIAVPPLENLSFDRSHDWLGVIAPFVISAATVGAERVLAVRLDSDRDLAAARATQVLRGYYQIEGGKLRIHAVVQDLSSNRVIGQYTQLGEEKANPLPLLLAVGQALSGKARPLASQDVEAWRAFGESLLAPSPERRLELARLAASRDPKLTFAQIAAAQTLASQGNSAGAAELLKRAIAAQPDEWQRTEAEALLARLEGKPDAALEAYRRAVRQSPRDTDLIRQLAEVALNHHQYKEAVEWLERAVALEPNQTALWNALGYAKAYLGDFEGALRSIDEYRRREPFNPNTYDSAGEIQFMAGRFAEAEKNFLEAQQKDPSFFGGAEFAKAAFARFLAGDEQGADGLWGRYVETRRAFHDVFADLRHAHWFLLTGRQEKAEEQLRRLAQGDSEAATRALLLLGVMQLQRGRREEAKALTQQALLKPKSAVSFNLAGILRFLAQPSAPPEEWQARAQRAFAPQTPQNVRNLLLAYAYWLEGHSRAARELLEPLYRATSPAAADELRLMLGKARLDLGDRNGAAQLLANHPLPPQTGEALLASLYFPHYRDWRHQALK
ncbi:MAG: tetratricopeptide repeat protein [Bryobacteraceae bacterium]|nr:tetratricopeptide repeat protein [Bryobacteraceae bacterium]MDW8378486.1 tetratricopeptide repeat protein [Bryobacterales bacterium]